MSGDMCVVGVILYNFQNLDKPLDALSKASLIVGSRFDGIQVLVDTLAGLQKRNCSGDATDDL